MKRFNHQSKTNKHAEMTDGAKYQQSAQTNTQNLQATLQDLLYNNYEPLPTYRLVTLQLVTPTKKATRQIWVTHVKLHKTISYVKQALSCYLPYFLLSNNAKRMHSALHTILQNAVQPLRINSLIPTEKRPTRIPQMLLIGSKIQQTHLEYMLRI